MPPLDFPAAPTTGATYLGWRFNGQSWVPAAEPFISKAGDTMVGRLASNGSAPITDPEFSNKKYVDDAVSTGQLWRGTWEVATNTPDLTAAANLANGYAWTAVTADPHVAELTTTALPGIPVGTEISNGDRLVYAEGPPAEFFLIHAAGITVADGDARYAQIVNALVRGTSGTYTQGTDFDGAGLPTIQQFLDRNINEHWFEAPVTVNFTTGLPGDTVLRDVFMGTNVLNLAMNSSVDSVGTLSIRSVSGVTLSGTNTNGFGALNIGANSDVVLSFAGNTLAFDMIVSGGATVAVGSGFSILAGAVTITRGSLLSVNNSTTFACTTLTNNGGTLVMQPTGTFSGSIGNSYGAIIDNRTGNLLDSFVRPLNALSRGVPGTYTQGTDFTDFQTFLNTTINNRFFDAPVTINLNVANTTPINMCNVFCNAQIFAINATAQVASSFTMSSVWGSNQVNIIITAPVAFTSFQAYSTDVRISGTGNFGAISSSRSSHIMLGLTATDVMTCSLVVNAHSRASLTANNSQITLTSLNVDGYFMIPAGLTALTVTNVAGSGLIIDNRTNTPLDTFARAPLASYPADAWYTVPGSYTWTCQRTGRYQLMAAGPGGGGAQWVGAGGSTARYSTGATGSVARALLRITAGQVLNITVGRGGAAAGSSIPDGSTARFGTNGNATTIIWAYTGAHDGTSAIANMVSVHWWMYGNFGSDGGSPSANTGGANATNIVLTNGINGSTSTLWNMLSGPSATGTSWHGPVQITGGTGGSSLSPGGDGSALIAFVNPL